MGAWTSTSKRVQLARLRLVRPFARWANGVQKPARVTAKGYAFIVEAWWDDRSEVFLEQSKAKAEMQRKEYGGTAPRTGKEPPHGITSIPLIAKVLTSGFCDDRLDGIEILDGVFLKHPPLMRSSVTSTRRHVRSKENRGGFGQD